jgi:plasmid replication initiation protein
MKRNSISQMDLFVPFLTDGHLRDQIDLMERPFFSLSKNKRLKEISYQSPDGSIVVNVKPHQSFGMATIWDADILIWAASQLNAYKNRGVNDPPRTLKSRSYDLLKAIGRGTGGYNAELLGEAIDRLKSTIIKTNIRPNDGEETSTFSWIDSGVIKKRRKTPTTDNPDVGVSITVSDWFYRSVLDDRALLSIDPAYFSITGGRERWLYRVARKHAGAAGANGFAIRFQTLFEKSGAEGTFRRFKFELLKVVERNELPGFDLLLEVGRVGDISLRMVRKAVDQARDMAVPDLPKASTAPNVRAGNRASIT